MHCDEVNWANTISNLTVCVKSRAITLPTKVHLVKAVVFPVVMYGYESWTIKAEHRRTDSFQIMVLYYREFVEQQGDQTSQS